MADTAAAPAPAASPKPEETSTPAVEVRATTAEATSDGVTAALKEDNKPETASEAQTAAEESAAATSQDQPTSEKDGENTGDKETGVEAGDNANGTPKANGRRKSTGGDKGKKQLKSKKSMANINLDVQAGTYWWARMKGYAAWPVIICDEEMLPESLLTKRPVSAIRPDGTYREDFADNGKNVRDRRYPVMFLGTNEFAWQVNTELTPLNLDDVKAAVDKDEQGKKAKNLWEAWKVAAQGNDLDYFKKLLMDHEKAMAEDAEERAAKEAEKAEKAAKKAKRKSKGGEDEDVEMEDAAGSSDSASKKSAKKRKKDADAEADGEKPAKTPKTKLKVNGPKTPAESSVTKAKKNPATKTKASKKSESESATPKIVEEELTPEQKFEKRSKAILYLRHRLQKGFLTRDQTPKEEEMQQMADYFTQLESHQDLEEKIIKETKINKVLKAIVKLDSIPKEEVYNFKQRSTDLLSAWGKNMPADAKANGVDAKEDTADAKSPVDKAATEEPKAEEAKAEEPKLEESKAVPNNEEASKDVEMKDAEEAPAENKAEEPKAAEAGDVAMEDVKNVERPTTETTDASKAEEKPTEKPAEDATVAA
ncbi:PWWP domain-containing protein [Macrophomina phaseolina MS6]|uniref:PWWP domain-containing protein n=2 Tax=Macrophomina phaseolina TaxID=35725 RepID=K2SHX7_MACPH|nr:PWWP domain-containing protein [Macrophomina phaseolina MS6]KAH7060627.1 hypothetical protein B0J12DRAFT_338919 [Macrophomina phaseolina]